MLVHSKIEQQVQGSHITPTLHSSSLILNILHSVLLQSLKQHWHIISNKNLHFIMHDSLVMH